MAGGNCPIMDQNSIYLILFPSNNSKQYILKVKEKDIRIMADSILLSSLTCFEILSYK